MLKQKIDAFIEGAKEEMIGDIIRLVSFASINGDVEENRACLRCFMQRAEELGFRTMTTSQRDVGIVEMGQGDETLGILVHLDVVGIGDRQKWTHNPFEGTLRDGFLWGRGTEDDKGAAIMSLYAMKAVQLLGLPIHSRVWLIVGTSEEGEWTDIASFKREFPLPLCGFSPDGSFPIYNREKGYADIVLDFHRDRKRGIRKLEGGESPNSIPSRAEIHLPGGEHIVADGVSSHSAVPKDGDNAIVNLCRDVESAGITEFDFVNFVNTYLGNGSLAENLHIDDNCENMEGEFNIPTTVVPTVISFEEDSVRLLINIRHRHGTTRKDILHAFSAHSQEYGFTVSLSTYLEPMRVGRDHLFLNIMREVSEEYGVDGSFKEAPGTSYAKSMENFVSWGPVFPDDPHTAHQEDERISVASMLLAAKLYGRFISRMTIID